MAKLTKYAIDAQGKLVYRSNGRLVPKNVREKLRVDFEKRGVYKGSKRVGTLGKGTKKEQRVIQEKSENRVKREQAKIRREQRRVEKVKRLFSKKVLTPKVKVVTSPTHDISEPVRENYKEFAQLYEAVPSITKIEPGLLTIEQRGLINFAKSLDTCTKAGYIDPETAQALFERYQVETRKGRKDMWNELHEYYEDVGYHDSG